VLHELYHAGEKILIFTIYKSQGACIWEHPGPVGNLAVLNEFQSGCEQGVWFLAQPVDGNWTQLERLKSEFKPDGRTRRSEENVTAWRYAVIESDRAPRNLWLRALVQLPLPIAAITTSGCFDSRSGSCRRRH
jgi:hypothetical protein